MGDVRDDWDALVRDVRALAEVERGRGVTHVGPLSLPEGVESPQPGAPGESLAAVREDMGDCTRCALHEHRTQIVFGVGSESADLVVVGEAPGYQEDQQGEPLVGPAGEMLDRMLENVIGLARSEVYILNIVKCRPPENRNPAPDEMDACAPFLRRQIEALDPRVLLVLGSVAFKALFETQEGITDARGTWRDWNGVPAMPTFHPAYLLRKPSDKRLTFEDIKKVRERYDDLTGRA
jgi:DNA polymerase